MITAGWVEITEQSGYGTYEWPALYLQNDDGNPVNAVLDMSAGDEVNGWTATPTGLKCGTDDIVTASGDVTRWINDGSHWYLLSFVSQSISHANGL